MWSRILLLRYPILILAVGILGVAEKSSALTDPFTGMEFVAVKGGCFPMGDQDGIGDPDERPVHEVCVDDFAIGRYEVTQMEWQQVMGVNPSHFKECGGSCPVEQVSWNDVQEFIRLLNGKTGKRYRLPTEAEWEYAARSGGKTGKNVTAEADAQAWYDDNSEEQTHPVGKKLPNPLGISDMRGNVWEWVQDCKKAGYYRDAPRNNPGGPDCEDRRVQRGGSWSSSDWMTRPTYRGSYAPDFGSWSFGFRLAVSSKQAKE